MFFMIDISFCKIIHFGVEYWWKLTYIDQMPFVVICTGQDFINGRIMIFSMYNYSIVSATKQFHNLNNIK